MFDIYQAVTDRIIGQLQNGVIPWKKPWVGIRSEAISYATGKPYSLLNQMLLGEPGEYLTFHQVQELGGRVRKGSKSRFVVFWKMLEKNTLNPDGTPAHTSDGKVIIETTPVLRYYNVFHIRDTEGIKPRHTVPLPFIAAEADEVAEAVIRSYLDRSGCKLQSSAQDEAYYSPARDLVSLPLREQFQSKAEYYSTCFHELTHSTGHFSRLNRFAPGAGAAAFGSESYSKEELIAEIGSAAILNTLAIETESSFQNSAAYIQSWLKALRDDKRLIISASAKAEKAVALILNQ